MKGRGEGETEGGEREREREREKPGNVVFDHHDGCSSSWSQLDTRNLS